MGNDLCCTERAGSNSLDAYKKADNGGVYFADSGVEVQAENSVASNPIQHGTPILRPGLEETSRSSSSTTKKKRRLPDGWSRGWSKTKQRSFYFNNITKTSQWTFPTGPPTLEASKQMSNIEKLPDGWAKHFDSQRQRVFYHHKLSGKSAWKLPKT